MTLVRRAVLALTLATLLMAAADADAATYFRAETSNQTAAGGATSLSINVPAGTAAGDVMVAVITSANGTAPATPSGWSPVAGASAGIGPGSGSLAVFTRVAGSSEPASYSWSLGGTFEASGAIGTYVGVDNVTPVQASSVASGNSKTMTAPGVTTTSNNVYVIAAVGYNATTSVTIGDPSGTTQRAAPESPAFMGTVVDDFIKTTAGATGGQSWSITSKSPYAAALIALDPASPGPLQFGLSAPNIATLPSVTLNGQAQTATTAMANFEVDDATGSSQGSSASGWNLTVSGDAAAGKSAVFKRYCPNATCGSDTGPGYIAGGATLPANSLTLVSTGASFSGGSGTAPAFQCGSSCNVDSAAGTKIVSAGTGGGGLWTSSGFAANSLRLSTATTLRVLPASEIYRVDLVWSLNTGP
jgi:hypothetical protein